MRVVVIGGTIFVGRAVVEELVAAGHDVMVVHRGQHEPDDLPEVEHLHVPRLELAGRERDLNAFRPDAVLDATAGVAAHADAVLEVMGDWRLLALSSMDVYRAYGSLNAGTLSDGAPLDETSPVREERYPYRGEIPGMDNYEKLDVEERYLAREGTVCRLPIVYGPRDYQRREWPVLLRIVSGRPQIPVGAGSWMCSRGSCDELARGIRLALEADVAVGEVFNLCEWPVLPVRMWWDEVVRAAGDVTGHHAELVPVPEHLLPDDLQMGAAQAQHLMVSPTKAHSLLGWAHVDPLGAEGPVVASVAWHLANPPNHEAEVPSFAADEAALKAAAAIVAEE